MFPIPKNEEERLESLRSYHILDTAEEQDFDELAMLASAICQTPIALISLIDDNRQWFKSRKGTNVKETPREISFCAHTIATASDILIVNDTTKDERFYNNPLVTGETKVTFYAGVPLVNEDGYSLGTLCVIDQQAKELTEEQVMALKVLAKQVIVKLELKRKLLALEQKNQELVEVNTFIQKFATTAAHDIKNPLSSMMLTSQALQIKLAKLEDEGCMRLINLNINSSNKLMVLLDEMLAYSKSPSSLLSNKQTVEFGDTLNKVLSLINVPPNFKVIVPSGQHVLSIAVVALEQILLNLLTNAIRYNDKAEGIIEVNFNEAAEAYEIQITDNGIGIPEKYLEKIFGNNFTLKITDRYNKQGTGIGLATVKSLVEALNGTIHARSALAQWTTFYIAIKK
jgi:signal transduction histidine kinase